ncbi:MAG: LptF/LptG family permease [Kiritimatiellia bacterium]|nr:LptF/LptG family permease [Kiritimatiellia bacterium]
MRLLTKYVLREFLIPLFYCMTGFVAIFVLFELSASFSRLLEAKLPFTTILSFFCGYLAPYFMWLAPAALMLATLYTMWSFCRHSEIIAMRASGVSFLAIVKPVLCVAILVAAMVAWVNESYVPQHAQWAKQLRAERFELSRLEKTDDLAYRDMKRGRMWKIDGKRDPYGHHLTKVKITQEHPYSEGVRQWTLLADSADYLDGEWWFTKPVLQHFDREGREVATPVPALDALSFRVFPEIKERPSDIVGQNIDWRYNSAHSKLRTVRQNKDLTADQRIGYIYDAWAQIMAPLACIVITLFAIPAGIASGRQSVFKGVLGALGMFFAYYGLVIFGMVSANKGWIPPVPAAVLPPIVFLGLGLRAFHRQR